MNTLYIAFLVKALGYINYFPFVRKSRSLYQDLFLLFIVIIVCNMILAIELTIRDIGQCALFCATLLKTDIIVEIRIIFWTALINQLLLGNSVLMSCWVHVFNILKSKPFEHQNDFSSHTQGNIRRVNIWI